MQTVWDRKDEDIGMPVEDLCVRREVWSGFVCDAKKIKFSEKNNLKSSSFV